MTAAFDSPAKTPRPRRRRRWLGWIALAFAGLVAATTAAVHVVGVAPRLLGPYVERRASGHHALIESTGRTIARVLLWLDRGVLGPRPDYPAWAVPPRAAAAAEPAFAREVHITDARQLPSILIESRPGDALTFAPGTYRFSGRGITVHRAGRADAPIALRAAQPGTVTLEFDLLEGFHVSAPHWVFENLTIVGVCRDHSACEHAFHVVGGATHVVIRNNVLRDFNAHIKINGSGGRFPDDGHIEGNRIYNTAPRATDAPVTPIDLVAASGWRIEGNLIADFFKAGGDFTSYGAFAKGGGAGNVFARNVVLCEHRLRGENGGKGRRVGLSFGGGGSDPRSCRDRRCSVEHERGVMRNNLIASCSDNGIYINRAAQTQLVHNTVLDTAGINVRFGESAAQAEGNWVDAPIAVRDGATLVDRGNHAASPLSMYLGLARLSSPFANGNELDLRWSGAPPRRTGSPDAGIDLCAARRSPAPAFGAFEDIDRCTPIAR